MVDLDLIFLTYLDLDIVSDQDSNCNFWMKCDFSLGRWVFWKQYMKGLNFQIKFTIISNCSLFSWVFFKKRLAPEALKFLIDFCIAWCSAIEYVQYPIIVKFAVLYNYFCPFEKWFIPTWFTLCRFQSGLGNRCPVLTSAQVRNITQTGN